MKAEVPFTEEDVKKYIDGLIDFWRKKWREELDVKREARDDTAMLVARCYIDAYQSVRKSLFGELKE